MRKQGCDNEGVPAILKRTQHTFEYRAFIDRGVLFCKKNSQKPRFLMGSELDP